MLRNRFFRICGFLLMVSGMAPGCSSPPVEETVSVGLPNPRSKPETIWTKEANFPAQNPEIEEAGDLLAKVVTFLRNKQNEEAQKSLDKAQNQIKKVVQKCNYDEVTCKKLKNVLNEVQTADKTLQRGNISEAIKQLSAVNKQLDEIEILPQEEYPSNLDEPLPSEGNFPPHDPPGSGTP